MDRDRAIELLKQYLDEIHTLRTLHYDNQDFKLWKSKIADVIKAGLEQEDLDSFTSARRKDNTIYVIQPGVTSLPYGKFYQDDITAKETTLKSVIQKYELLGLSTNHENHLAEKQRGKMNLQTSELVKLGSIGIWKDIYTEFGITKMSFGRKINFVTDPFKRTVLFRDVEQAFSLASSDFSKPAVILAGSVIEELLRLYLEFKGFKPVKDDFDGYIQTCEQNRLLKDNVSRLSHSIRQFRNLVHLSAEKTKKHTISKATAIGAVSFIFTVANDF